MAIDPPANGVFNFKRTIKITVYGLLIVFYAAYAYFFIKAGRGPVDFDTFLDIGARLLEGRPVYGVNSLYPMPFVGIFAFFAWLPRPVAFVLWFGGQVLASIYTGGFWTLGFPPTLAIQASVPALLGLWGYRRSPVKDSSGVWLALTCLKPQLGLVPCAWAAVQWYREWRAHRSIPRQALVFAASLAIVYLPWFFVYPNWVQEWLSNPRGLRERAMAGILPRTLYYFNLPPGLYWTILAILAILLFLWLRKRGLDLDRFVLWGFIVSPLVHDYDLLQLIPVINTPRKRSTALLLSLPLWIVVLFFYNIDAAWYVCTLIAPGLLAVSMFGSKATQPVVQVEGEKALV
jgi:hypothetical protein